MSVLGSCAGVIPTNAIREPSGDHATRAPWFGSLSTWTPGSMTLRPPPSMPIVPIRSPTLPWDVHMRKAILVPSGERPNP
jgi:hypothetical protein